MGITARFQHHLRLGGQVEAQRTSSPIGLRLILDLQVIASRTRSGSLHEPRLDGVPAAAACAGRGKTLLAPLVNGSRPSGVLFYKFLQQLRTVS